MAQTAQLSVIPTTKKKTKIKRHQQSWFMGLTAKRRMAVITGSVGVCVLLLSVIHCTEALMRYTGSPVYLAALLAIGIDAGMVVCEMASLLSKDKKWAKVYIILSVALSIVLNGSASAANADATVIAWVVGGIIPVLVFVLGQVAGGLWE